MEPRFVIRSPPLPRFWKAFLVVHFAFAVLFIVGGIAGGIPVVAVLVAIALVVGLAWLLKRRPHLGVLGYDHELVIRNPFRELRIPLASPPSASRRRPLVRASGQTQVVGTSCNLYDGMARSWDLM